MLVAVSRTLVPIGRPFAYGWIRLVPLWFGMALIPSGAVLLWNCIRTGTVAGAFAGTLFLVGGVVFTYSFVKLPKSVEISDGALVVREPLGPRHSRERSIRWQSIASVQEGRLGRAWVPQVELRNGEKLKIDAITTHRRDRGPWNSDPVSQFVSIVSLRVSQHPARPDQLATASRASVEGNTPRDPWEGRSPLVRWIVRPIVWLIGAILDGL